MIKILHIGDIHLGYSYGSKDKILHSLLEGSIEKSFEKAVSFSISNDVDLFIIAGDLFDFAPIGPRTFDFFINMVKKLKSNDIKVVYSLGNHDNLTIIQENLIAIIRNEVILFDTSKVKSYKFQSKDGEFYNVHGVGHEFEKVSENLIELYPVAGDDEIYNIGVAHCFVEGVSSSGAYDKYLPTTYEDLISKKYDYFALGHIHLPMIYKDLNISYSGSLQGLSFKEDGPRGGNYIEIDKFGTSIKHIPLSNKIYKNISIELDDEKKDYLELIEFIKIKTKEYLKEINYKSSLIRIIFSGNTSLEILDILNNDQTYISEQLALGIGCEYVAFNFDNLRVKYKDENVLMQSHFLGYSLSKFDENIDKVKIMMKDELIRNGIDAEKIDIDTKVAEVKEIILESLLKR